MAAPSEPSARVSPAPILLALACAFLCGATFGVLVIDFGGHVDGVGIGLEWSRPLGDEYGLRAGAVLVASLVQGGLSLTAFQRARARSFGVLGLVGIAVFGLLAGVFGASKAIPAWWKLGCDRGHAYACYAAGGVTEGAVSRALDERACSGDVGPACRRIVQEDPSRLPAICAQRASACRGPGTERPIRSRCRSLEDLCGAVDPPSP